MAPHCGKFNNCHHSIVAFMVVRRRCDTARLDFVELHSKLSLGEGGLQPWTVLVEQARLGESAKRVLA